MRNNNFNSLEVDWLNEKTILNGKDWIDFEGITKEKYVISLELADNLAINYGNYQPVAWNCNSKFFSVI